MTIRPLALVPLELDRSLGSIVLVGTDDGLAGQARLTLPGQLEVAFTLDEPFRLVHLVEHPEADPGHRAERDATLTLLMGAGWNATPDGPFTLPASLVPRWSALATAAACLELGRREEPEVSSRWRTEALAAADLLPDAVRPVELGPRSAPTVAATADRGGRVRSTLQRLVELGGETVSLAPAYGPDGVAAETWFPLRSRPPGVRRLLATTTYDAAELLLEVIIDLTPGFDLEATEIYAVAHLGGRLRGIGRFTTLTPDRSRAAITLRPHAPDELWVSVVEEVATAEPAYDPTLVRAMWLAEFASASERGGRDGQAVEAWQRCSALYLRAGAGSPAARAAQNAVDVLVRTGRVRVAEGVARRSVAAGLDVVVDPSRPGRPAPPPYESEGLDPL